MADRVDSGAVARQIFLGTMMRAFSSGRSAAPSGAKQLAGAMRDLVVPKGSVIYRAGEAPERIYFVVRGKVRLTAEGQPDWVLDDRAVLGIIDANLERPHMRTAVALEDVHLLWIAAEDYHEMLEDNFEQVRGVAYGLCSGLRGLVLELAPHGGFPPLPHPVAAADERPLDPVERLLVLRAIPAFARASIQALTTLADVAEERTLHPSGPIALPAASDASLFLVARGAVALRAAEPSFDAGFAAGTMVGGMGALGWNDPTFSLVPLVTSRVLRVREEDYFDVMEEHFDLARSLFAAGAEERERLANLAAQRRAPI